MKVLRIHHQVESEIKNLDLATKSRLAELFLLLAAGENLGMPLSRPMPNIANGVHEIRLRDRCGLYRIFYYVKHHEAVLIFHFLNKKTQATPNHEIKIAKRRLESMR